MARKSLPPPPPKPARMSNKKYRELYDSTPVMVEVPDVARFRCAGRVSAEVVANTYRRQGHDVTIRPA